MPVDASVVTLSPYTAFGAPSPLVFAGTTDGIFVSPDFGQHWQLANLGVSGTAYAITPEVTSHANLIYAGTSSGVFRTVDGGARTGPRSSAPAAPRSAATPYTRS